jgi:hypothetical protein
VFILPTILKYGVKSQICIESSNDYRLMINRRLIRNRADYKVHDYNHGLSNYLRID